MYFFIGFVVLAQIGGRILDREGAKRAVVLGCAIAAVGFGFWASKATTLSFGKQQIWVIVAGAGMGMMLGPANTDAVNRAGNLSYGEATGITQTIRNYGASLGLAALGTILLFDYRSHLTTSLQKMGDPHAAPRPTASRRPSRAAGRCRPFRISSRSTSPTPPQTVLYVMSGIMAFAAVVALFGLQRGRQELVPLEDDRPFWPGRLTHSSRPMPRCVRPCLTFYRRGRLTRRSHRGRACRIDVASDR